MRTEFWSNLTLTKRLYDQTLGTVCDQYALARMELDLLLFLEGHPDWDTATDMIERRGLTKSHVSTSIKELERRGYLERSFQEGNRKTVHLRVLPAAEPLIREGRSAQHTYFSLLFAGITSQERAELEDIFGRIAENARTALTGGTQDGV